MNADPDPQPWHEVKPLIKHKKTVKEKNPSIPTPSVPEPVELKLFESWSRRSRNYLRAGAGGAEII